MIANLIHKDAAKVIKYMKELGIDEVIQERVYLAMWTEKSYSFVPSSNYVKTTSDEYIKTL